MSAIKKYIIPLLLIAGHYSYAQPNNDSVFNTTTLSSFRLFDVAQHHLTSLKPTSPSARLKLFVFLSPECPLCQNYTKILNELHTRYAGKITLYGIIPGKTYKPAEVTAFSGKYKITYPLLIDESMRLSRYLQASVTPEVILLGPDNELIYKGAIDNWYKALGKARVKTTESYLQDAIEGSLRQQPAPIKRTIPVGCTINDF